MVVVQIIPLPSKYCAAYWFCLPHDVGHDFIGEKQTKQLSWIWLSVSNWLSEREDLDCCSRVIPHCMNSHGFAILDSMPILTDSITFRTPCYLPVCSSPPPPPPPSPTLPLPLPLSLIPLPLSPPVPISEGPGTPVSISASLSPESECSRT